MYLCQSFSEFKFASISLSLLPPTCAFTAAIVNRGWYFTQHIVKSIDGKPNPDERFKKKHVTKVEPRYFDVVLKGMKDVFIGGTARGLASKEFTQLGQVS